MAGQDNSGVRSVQLAIDVLEAVAFSEDELGVTQIAERLSVTKGSVHRHLHTLVERGYLVQNPATTRYRMGARSRLLSRLATDTDLVQISEGPMRALRDELGHTVVLSEMTPRGALVVSKATNTSAIEIGVRSGSELAFHASAQGKVMLAYAPKPFQERVLARKLLPFTDKTITSAPRIEEELIEIAKRGFASAPEEAMLGINAVAAPIFDSQDACVASIAIVGSIQFLPIEPIPRDTGTLIETSQQISRRLGHGRQVDHGRPAKPAR
ncbi:IclR family transcriptional regulator [Bosea sp. (in: a-proteobacteria)]|uniref:IclR family transcriptional regulator n=1 Tax=Bosea sp. (in: a-proteobacteria) TaxID=1871050 RepID=UPI00263353B7|nr:IclR family transcriptional regulator [Bosea sp. (in: a-proteobacteria)]MCO5090921.1 IclR family transcriptional regulator [Bosea sp. (in: a-proteobacteria)]